tara:strand:+ start:172 stop:369 length:198 start_codon:yes stop_codon:yes gene_type:complete
MTTTLGQDDEFFLAAVRQGLNIATSKNQSAVVIFLAQFDRSWDGKSSHSATQLLKTKSFRIESNK